MGRSKPREFQADCENLVNELQKTRQGETREHELARKVEEEFSERLEAWTGRVSSDAVGSVESSGCNRKSQENKQASLSGMIRFMI